LQLCLLSYWRPRSTRWMNLTLKFFDTCYVTLRSELHTVLSPTNHSVSCFQKNMPTVLD
jgi:hypothetical protein